MLSRSDESSSLGDIETPRLLLRLFTPEAIQAGLSGDIETMEESLAAKIPADLLQEPKVLQHARARLAEDVNYLPWSARAIILKDKRQMVGHVRFHTQPNPHYLQPYANDAVEFGYAVFEAYRRQGYATEALIALMRWAERFHGVGRFVASVSPSNQPSMNLVAKLGFAKIGQWLDPIDCVEYVYVLDVSNKA
jgi:RimJ/RimL family protein N-acetyltransferase